MEAAPAQVLYYLSLGGDRRRASYTFHILTMRSRRDIRGEKVQEQRLYDCANVLNSLKDAETTDLLASR